MPDPHVGRWSNGEPIDIAGVPLDLPSERARTPIVEQAFDAANGGSFVAQYWWDHKRSNGVHVYVLRRVTELMPPITPEIAVLTDDARLPMPTVAEEIEQRRREWKAHA